jgi:hypothetical protein
MLKKIDLQKREAEKFNENLTKMKRERESCVEGAIQITKNLADLERGYREESYENILTNETAQMEKLLSSVEMNSLKACSALEEVNNELTKLALENFDFPFSGGAVGTSADGSGGSVTGLAGGVSSATATATGAGTGTGTVTRAEEYLTMQDLEMIQKNNKLKINAAAVRLKDIFVKATKQYNSVIASFSSVSPDQQDASDGQHEQQSQQQHHHQIEDHHAAHIASLQKRIKDLKKELEISEMKSRSVIVQRSITTLLVSLSLSLSHSLSLSLPLSDALTTTLFPQIR